MKNVLLISGHPCLADSVSNRTIIEEFAKLCPQAQLRQLDTLYPDYRIDVPQEQQLLVEADIIIWQFPFYWYSMPALLKKWLDDVFTHGFAHGSKGKALQGKELIISFTTGAAREEYRHGQAMNYEVEEFLTPFRQTATLCGLHLNEALYSNGMMYIPGLTTDADLERIKDKASEHARRLFDLVTTL
ncbi:MAG: NAD(P)H-dependent oxidoreductase [Succinivibrio sp.]|nr:NAD(P)H-dependent oxidoreductase [Succinivibrio sp.]